MSDITRGVNSMSLNSGGSASQAPIKSAWTTRKMPLRALAASTAASRGPRVAGGGQGAGRGGAARGPRGPRTQDSQGRGRGSGRGRRIGRGPMRAQQSRGTAQQQQQQQQPAAAAPSPYNAYQNYYSQPPNGAYYNYAQPPQYPGYPPQQGQGQGGRGYPAAPQGQYPGYPSQSYYPPSQPYYGYPPTGPQGQPYYAGYPPAGAPPPAGAAGWAPSTAGQGQQKQEQQQQQQQQQKSGPPGLQQQRAAQPTGSARDSAGASRGARDSGSAAGSAAAGSAAAGSAGANGSQGDWKQGLKVPPKDTRIQTADVKNRKGVDFEDFSLKKDLLRGIFEYGFERPSPIQEESIPVALLGKHVLARAKNGTGKTASFTIPVLERVDNKSNKVQAVIMEPARELALQTAKVVKELGKHCGINTIVTTGGTSLRDDIIRLKRAVHIIVATPGRLLDLCERRLNERGGGRSFRDRGSDRDSGSGRRIADLSAVKVFVMDEADKLLSDGYSERKITSILRFTPRDRQILCFSATFPVTIRSFMESYMKDVHQINLMDELTLKGVTQYYAFVEEREKIKCLRTLFKNLEINQCIIFCSTTERVELLARTITQKGFSCHYIHGRMGQEDRNKIFHNFRTGKFRNLVASDVIARGIDVLSVNVVINFDFPETAETYLHRIGRSGRFGHLGIAINLITFNEKQNFYAIEKELGTEIAPFPGKVDRKLYCV